MFMSLGKFVIDYIGKCLCETNCLWFTKGFVNVKLKEIPNLNIANYWIIIAVNITKMYILSIRQLLDLINSNE